MPTSTLTPRSAALATEIAESVDRARVLAEASKAKATRSAYASDLKHFEAYCERIGVSALPADPAVVGTYLATLHVTPSPLKGVTREFGLYSTLSPGVSLGYTLS